MVKKAYMKTIEVVLMVVLSIVFLIVIIPRSTNFNNKQNENYLIHLETNEDFRQFTVNNNGCINKSNSELKSYFDGYLPLIFNYYLCIDTIPNSLPLTQVTVDSIIFVGNYSDTKFRTIRLFYWID